ncbi:MAG TPA: ABC transporter substrate-binding protein [Actinomycetota bacterium]
MKRAVVPLVLAATLAVALAACGNSPARQAQAGARPGQTQVALSLDWTPNPDHVGLYYAQSKGLFQQAGLTVRMRAPSDPSAPLKLVALRKADLAISYEPDLFFAAAKHLPVTAVASVIPVPLNSLIALPSSGITTPASLKGRKVGITGIPSDDAILQTLERSAGLSHGDVTPVSVGYNLVPALLSHKVDAILGGYRNVEAIQIAQQTGRAPVTLPVDRLGVPSYDELVLVANTTRLRGDPAYATTVRRFITAMLAGASAARADQPAAVTAMTRATTYTPKFLQASVPTTLTLLTPPDRPIGCLDQSAWQRYGDWMHTTGLLPTAISATTVMTTAYLPSRC